MAPKRLVIVDDDTIIRLNLREQLQHLGYVVAGEAGDAQSAIHLTRELRPDLVIMDVRIAGSMDGIDAAAAITAEHIAPVLLLTGFSDQALVQRATAAGEVGYLLKPVTKNELRPVIEITLARCQEFQAATAEADELRDQLETRKLVERAKGVLMQHYSLSEPEAFQRMQKISMNSRKPMRSIAEAILLAQQIA
jgi:AmiR/NasT family two-component response regulator